MLSTGGEAEASSIAQIRTCWKKFKELLPLLTSRVFSHKMKGNIYKICVRSAMKARWIQLDGCVASGYLIKDPLKKHKRG